MFKRISLVTLMLTSISSYGSDIGIGVSIQDGDNAIYVPYMLSESVMLEGNIVYSDRESEFDEFKSEFKRYEAGIGLFYKFNAGEKIFSYLGGRVSYIKSESTSAQILTSTQVFSAGIVSGFNNSFKSTSDGYRFAPTLGVAYKLTESFSIAAEAEWNYEDLDIDQESGFSDSEGSASSTGTETRVVFRYLF